MFDLWGRLAGRRGGQQRVGTDKGQEGALLSEDKCLAGPKCDHVHLAS